MKCPKNSKLRACRTSVRGIVTKGNKILLAQRNHKSSNGGFWEFPGGKTDGQNPKIAIKRELKEETGLKTKNMKKITEYYDGKYWTQYFEGDATGNIKMQHSELDGIGWFTKSQAKKLNLVEHTRRLI